MYLNPNSSILRQKKLRQTSLLKNRSHVLRHREIVLPQNASQRTEHNRQQESVKLWDCPRELQKSKEYTKAGTNKTLACIFEDMGKDLSLTRFGLTDFSRHVIIIKKSSPGKK